MNYGIHDILELMAAVALVGVVFVLPAIAIGEVTNALTMRRLRTGANCLIALVIGYAILPVVDSLMCRWLGLTPALIVNLLLAAYGLRILWRKGLPPAAWLPLVLLWLAVLIYASADYDRGGSLYPSLLMIDDVKHAATIRALVESATVPPYDPFFLRPTAAGYYYYYYVVSALAERLAGGFIGARAAFAGQVFWTGLALCGLVILLLKKVGFGGRRLSRALVLLMPAAGMQILWVSAIGLISGVWLGQINWWNEQVTSWPISLLWVPQHVASLIACWAGFALLASAMQRQRQPRNGAWDRDIGAAALAALAFASAVGMSVWVTVGAVATVGVWLVLLLIERRWRAALLIVAAGAVSVLIALPDLIDLVQNRSYGGPPVTLTVRHTVMLDNLFAPGFVRELVALLTLPLNYLFEFGVFLIGAFIFWKQKKVDGAGHNEVARLLTISAIVTLIIASFIKSTIVNNDLGWRVILFAQLAALLWTVKIVAPPATAAESPTPIWRLPRRQGVIFFAALALGYVGTLYDLVALRFYQPLNMVGTPAMRRDPRVDRDIRKAYEWLAAGAQQNVVSQHNPNVDRAFGYGLYGRARVAVSDRHNAILFGAPSADVRRRIEDLTPVFAGPMTTQEAWRRLSRNQVAIAVVTADDPIWHDRTSWIWRVAPLYALPHVRVISVPGAGR